MPTQNQNQNNDQLAANVEAVAKRLSDYARGAGWSAARLCQEYPDLGDVRTFRDICNGNGAKYDLARWERDYTAVEAAIKQRAQTPDRVICTQTSAVKRIARAIATVTGRPDGDNRRIVIVEGLPSSGKTTAAAIIANNLGSRVMRIEVLQVWRDRPQALLGAILRGVGEKTIPTDALEAFEATAAALTVSRKCVILDEAHHLGIRTINTIKALINVTRSEFVLMAIPKLLRNMQRKTWDESQQLVFNRLSECITLDFKDTDIEKYLRQRFPAIDTDTARTSSKKILAEASGIGNMSFVVAVADEIDTDKPITSETVAEAIALAKSRR